MHSSLADGCRFNKLFHFAILPDSVFRRCCTGRRTSNRRGSLRIWQMATQNKWRWSNKWLLSSSVIGDRVYMNLNLNIFCCENASVNQRWTIKIVISFGTNVCVCVSMNVDVVCGTHRVAFCIAFVSACIPATNAFMRSFKYVLAHSTLRLGDMMVDGISYRTDATLVNGINRMQFEFYFGYFSASKMTWQ